MASHRVKDTALYEKVVATISKNGPLSLANYISYALSDPDYGYYQTRDPLGMAGDFITAPEISSLFGEMCGLYLAHVAELSRLRDPAIFELGPGRASLLLDMRRVWQRIMPSLINAPVHLLETSPHLRCVQQDRLSDITIFFHENLDDLPSQPLFAIANEFFDALPVAQAILRQNASDADGIWRHRLVGLIDGRLGFIDGPSLRPEEAHDWALEVPQTEGINLPPSDNINNHRIAEYCPLAATYAGKIAHHLRAYGGACLIIDYGRDG